MQKELLELNDLLAIIHNNTEAIQLDKSAAKKAGALQQHFLISFLQQQTQKAVSWLVLMSQKACSIWLDHLYQQRKNRKKKNNLLDELEIQLASFTDFIYRQFPEQFDLHQPMPHTIWEQRQNTLEALWESFITRYREAIDPSLITLIRSCYNNMTTEQQPLTYYQYEFWFTLWKILPSDITGIHTDCNEALIHTLIRYNLNSKEMIHAILERLLQKMDTHTDPLRFWAEQFSLIHRIPDLQKDGLEHDELSAKKQLLLAIKKEILIAQKFKRLNHPIHEEEHTPIQTDLTAAQIALLIRLKIECGLYRSENITETLKIVSKHYLTRHKEIPRAEVLRTKYYSPDPATIKILRERLLQMLTEVSSKA